MWEITLIGQKEDYVYFVLLEDMLKNCLKVNPIIAISNRNSLLCSIAISDRKQIKTVKKCILEIIIKICKEEYFRENLNNVLGSDQDLNNFILHSLVTINLQDEVDYARIKVKFSKIWHIRSLMRFRLNKLYAIWDRFIKYFNFTFADNITDEIYLEFLKFLATSSMSNSDIMYLEQNKDTMCILDKDKKLLSSIPKNDEIGVVVNLIVLSPKKLIINCYNSLSSKIAGLIQYIFQDRISILL